MTPAVTPQQPIADRALVARMAQGDRPALVELLARYRTTLYAAAYALMPDPEDAEAVVVEVFDQACHEAAGVGPDERVHTWLVEIARAVAGRRVAARQWPRPALDTPA